MVIIATTTTTETRQQLSPSEVTQLTVQELPPYDWLTAEYTNAMITDM